MSKQQTSSILIASVLKPWDDHRMHEKWGYFFKENSSKEIHLFGNFIDFKTDTRFQLHDSKAKNTIIARFFAGIRLLALLIKTKPSILIIETFELLPSAFLYHLFSRKNTRFYYDIQENYRLNIQKQGNYFFLKKNVYCLYIQFCEFLATKFIHHYFVSEQIYLSQLHFLNAENTTLLTNYYSYNQTFEVSKKTDSYLITGTLSKSYGLEIACDWIRVIKNQNPRAEITILGHLTDNYALPADIQQMAVLSISKYPIAHRTILEAIAQTEFLLLPYLWTNSFVGCTPVKLYESIALKAKVICTYESTIAHNISHTLLEFRDKNFKIIESESSRKDTINSFINTYEQDLLFLFTPYL